VDQWSGSGSLNLRTGGVLRVPSGGARLTIGGSNTIIIHQGGQVKVGDGSILEFRSTSQLVLVSDSSTNGLSCGSGSRVIFSDQSTMSTGPSLGPQSWKLLTSCTILSNSSMVMVLDAQIRINATEAVTIIGANDIRINSRYFSMAGGSSLTLASPGVISFTGSISSGSPTSSVAAKIIMNECNSVRFEGPILANIEWRSLPDVYGIPHAISPCNKIPSLYVGHASHPNVDVYTPLIVTFGPLSYKVYHTPYSLLYIDGTAFIHYSIHRVSYNCC
jgi:hypothetical protein